VSLTKLATEQKDASSVFSSAVSLLSLTTGFMLGIDIYDAILVIRTQKALESFSTHKATLGTDIGIAVGPYGAGAAAEYVINCTSSLEPLPHPLSFLSLQNRARTRSRSFLSVFAFTSSFLLLLAQPFSDFPSTFPNQTSVLEVSMLESNSSVKSSWIDSTRTLP